MRKFLTILAGLIVALGIAVLIFWWQGKSIGDLFKGDDQAATPQIPTQDTQPNPSQPTEPVNLTYTQRIQKGDDYFEQAFYTLAAEQYAQAALLAPSQIEPYLRLIETHLKLRNYEKALANIETVLSLDPNNDQAKYAQIQAKIKLSAFEEAKTLLNAFPAGTTFNAQILYYQGLFAALANDNEGAKARFNEVLTASPEANLSEKVNRILEAYTTFEATQAAQEQYLDILLAKALNENEEYELAIHILKETLKVRGDIRDGWILLGFAYLNLENYSFARTAFDKAYSLDSTWSTTQYFLGITHKELGNYEDAIVYFNAALKGDFKAKIVLQNHLADLYFETKDYAKAVNAYEEVLAVNQQDINAFVRPIWLYLDYLEEPQKALKLAQAALAAFPDSAMSYNLVGWSYIGMGDYKNANANLQKALQLDPELPAAHYNSGLMNEKWGNYELALENYQEAYQLDPNGSIGNLAAQHYNALLARTSE